MIRSGWVAALRIARRDARRNLRRSALVVAMIALPVAGIVVGSVLIRTNALTADDRAARQAGQADLRVDVSSEAVAADVIEGLPDGARVVRIRHASASLLAAGTLTHVGVMDAPLTDPLVQGYLELTSGRVPERPGEAAVAPRVLDQAGIEIGDELTLNFPDVTLTVTGTAVRPYHTSDPLVVVAPGALASSWPTDAEVGAPLLLVELTGNDPVQVVSSLGAMGDDFHAETRAQVAARPMGEEPVSFVYVGGGLALFEAALMVSAAFAVGARRQLRTLGLVAANGGERKHLSRVVLSSGIVAGVVGAGVGVAAGLGLAAASLPWLEQLTDRLDPPLRVAPLHLVGAALLGVVAAVLAAWLPARSASRVSPLAALAGRRPIPSGRRGPVVVGTLAVVAGTAVAIWGAQPLAKPPLILAGAILVVVGFTAVSPALVGLLGRPAGRAPTSLRLALRDAARHNTRTGPAVAAIMAALSLPIALSAFAQSTIARDEAQYIPSLRDDQVAIHVTGGSPDAELSTVASGRAAAHAVQQELPGSTAALLRTAALSPTAREHAPGPVGREGPYEEPDGSPVWIRGGTVTDWRGEHRVSSALAVGDAGLLDALGVPDAADVLRTGKVVALGGGTTQDGHVHVLAAGAGESLLTLPAVEVPAPELRSLPRFVVSESTAVELGLGTRPQAWLVRSPRALTDEDKQAVRATVARFPQGFAQMEESRFGEGRLVIFLGLGLCALIALGIVAIATALNLAEARDDLATLTAVGASPRIRRTLTAVQASTLASLGGVLAVPAGLLPVVAVLLARSDTGYPIVVPWLTIATVAVVVPLLAGAGGAAFTRPRTVRRRRLA